MNNQEIEIKFYVSDLKQVETRLVELGAKLIQPRVFESNIRYDLPDGSLHTESRVLRLRRADDVRLTYKGRGEITEGVLTRDEFEFTVGDFETARQFIEALGYMPFATYEKIRTTYELNEAHIMLDELPFGDFVEIEGSGVDSIRLMATSLGLEMEAAVDTGYLSLHKRLCATLPLDPVKLTFAALKDFKVSPEMLVVRPADAD
jgi:adenylate cyclase, class 2